MPRLHRCRRTRRDEEAGLIFRWRVPGGSRGRTLTAIALGALLFAGTASLFRVTGNTARTVNRETAHFLFLPPDSEEGRKWFEWAQQNSPFPDRWTLDTTAILRQHMELFEAELAQRAAYRPLLRPFGTEPREFPLPELFDPAAPRLPPVPRPVTPAGPPAPLAARIVATPGASLAPRWGGVSWTIEDLLESVGPRAEQPDPREFLGMTRRFFVMVDRDGMVVFCQNLNEDTRVLDEVLAVRLRQARLAPDAGSDEFVGGFIDVAVRGGRTEGGKEEP